MDRSRLLRLGVAGFVVSAQLVVAAAATAQSDGCGPAGARPVPVATAAQLATAFQRARPGDVIQLQPGRYDGQFTLARSGRRGAPIVVCGRGAVLDGGSVISGYTLHLQSVSYVKVFGLGIWHGQKAVMLDASSHVTLAHLHIRSTGYEGVHFRHASTHDVLRDSTVAHTGLVRAEFGEGVYVGSAKNHWCDTWPCQPDRTRRITIADNTFGPNIPAESVDIKEGTSSGTVTGNSFDGRAMSAAYAWVDVKGNNWRIARNTGSHSRRDGFSDNIAATGWGNNNVFAHNHADVDAHGYGFRINTHAQGVAVDSDNVVVDAALGASNVPEQSG